jgi:hypothetical protein
VTAAFADQEIWHVLVASDDMKRMNVDQLDDAFRLDVVDASTLVWKTGMSTWRRLGSLAGIDEEETQTITKQMMPADILRLMPPPPPPPRPAPSVMPKPPKPPRPLHAQPVVPAFKTQQFAAPLVTAPMYVPQLHAPDPYVLPKRRVSVPSEVDFRRKSGGVRLGRWLVGLLVISAGVLVCYRQNLLREGARRVGLENKYLYGEKRAVDYVTAKAPRPLQNALKRLALLPGPNAAAAALPKPAPRAAEPVAPPQPVAPAMAKVPADDVKTVSLDSLPVLATEATEPATTRAAAVVPAAALMPKASAPKPVVASKPVAKATQGKRHAQEEEEAPAPKPKKVEKAEPKPVAEKAAPPPPPSGNESFLKAAIRSAIAQDAAKGK